MKARNLLILLGGLLMLPLYLGSCAVDRWAAYAERTQSARWIEDTMRVWYYWSQDIPNTNDLNYFSPPFDFFESLLSSEDAFSTIDSLGSTTRSIPYTDYSYGFEFTTNQVEGNDTALYAHVLYVVPDSPAGEIGLERGDWILAMDGEPITENNYTRLYGDGSMQLTVGHYDAELDTILAYEEPQLLAGARAIDDNPVHYRNVYMVGGRRVGYLVYNHFTSGLSSTSTEYDEDLREAFQYFSSQQVNEFVLDLRYNNGGQVSCAQLLSTMLAPASALGQPLCYLEYRANSQEDRTPLYLDENLIQGGANLNLSRLYVLTGSETASASEMLINCLKPYMEVVLIGDVTVGKNMGSLTFTSPELLLTMSPMVCKIYNSQGESDYAEGFQPDISVDESSDLTHFLPFGNQDELMLSTALGQMSGDTSASQDAASLRTAVKHTSVTRKASKAVEMK